MRAVVCTYARHDLAAMAVESLAKYAAGISGITVLDASGAMESCPGADVRHVKFPRFGGAMAARRTFPGEALLCIDDDVLLLGHLDVSRYKAGLSKPANGHMLYVHRPEGVGHEALSCVRVRSPRQLDGHTWATLAARHRCELVDAVWLHIDKGSAGDIQAREELVAAIKRGGPGTELKALLKTIGIEAAPNCACNQRAAVMDQRGCDWCEENISQIDGWLAEEAKKRRLPYLSLAGKAMIRVAIRRARKKGNNS